VAKRSIELEVNGFFITDTENKIRELANQFKVRVACERGKGFFTYPLTVTILGAPSKIIDFVKFLETLKDEFHFEVIKL
jgi:hypothetical protein